MGNEGQIVQAVGDIAQTGLTIAATVSPEARMALLAFTVLDRLIDTYVTLARKDPDWKPTPLMAAYKDFDGLAAAGRALRGQVGG
jgi:hypothetical protein